MIFAYFEFSFFIFISSNLVFLFFKFKNTSLIVDTIKYFLLNLVLLQYIYFLLYGCYVNISFISKYHTRKFNIMILTVVTTGFEF